MSRLRIESRHSDWGEDAGGYRVLCFDEEWVGRVSDYEQGEALLQYVEQLEIAQRTLERSGWQFNGKVWVPPVNLTVIRLFREIFALVTALRHLSDAVFGQDPHNDHDKMQALQKECMEALQLNPEPQRLPEWSPDRLREIADQEPGGLMACSPEILAELREMAKTDPHVKAVLERAGIKE